MKHRPLTIHAPKAFYSLSANAKLPNIVLNVCRNKPTIDKLIAERVQGEITNDRMNKRLRLVIDLTKEMDVLEKLCHNSDEDWELYVRTGARLQDTITELQNMNRVNTKMIQQQINYLTGFEVVLTNCN